ncbi:MAG: magnesium chelatase [Candidatus Cloacimonetes bacterium]|nr:magnesium chelatase [Candidatus Cloacimonadota bacterium]
MTSRPATLGELKASGYRPRTVKDEMRANLLRKLRSGETLFPGIVGYEDTVVPHIVNAILARQNFILLGLRGQAKSRIIRQLVSLLDEEIPIIAGSEVNDDPLAPISKFARQLIEEDGDNAPIAWVGRDARFVEKLATPDVTIADIIGDVDPIKAARGGHLLSDELTIHYGLLPRANRGIFAVNELPDLAGRIQVGLFNIMQEGDVQIKGYPVRLPLDVLLVFTANPEDYTARGKIITPLKDRIGAEIMTHYPESIDAGMQITLQEAWLDRGELPVDVPPIVAELIERVAFLARADRRIDQRSGVSQRMPISVIESAVSNAERRALIVGEDTIVPRPSDVYAALPAITGKMELEYEGELVGAERIARELISRAAAEILDERGGQMVENDLEEIVDYFERGGVLQLGDTAGASATLEGFRTVPGLVDAAEKLALVQLPASDGVLVAACELILEALVAERRLSRSETGSYSRAARRAPPPGPAGPIEI